MFVIQPSSNQNINWNRSLVLGVSIAVFISFINLFLEPFKTGDSSKLLVLGYSACFLISYLTSCVMEFFLFQKLKPIWANRTLAFFISLFVLGALSIYGYDLIVIKGIPLTWSNFLPYTVRIVVPFSFLVLPMIYLGRTAQISISNSNQEIESDELIIKGSSNNEVLHTSLDNLLYVKAENNYCNIYYLNADGKVAQKLFRLKISDLVDDVECLSRCHRGYAINLKNVVHVNQLKSKASVQIKWCNDSIPVSKTYIQNIQAQD